jgi:hypothetical protein
MTATGAPAEARRSRAARNGASGSSPPQLAPGATVRFAVEMRALRCAFAVAAIAALPGCGDEEDRANANRPPAAINVTAAIIDGRVLVSPKRFGAGPIRLIVTNQTDSDQRLTLESDDSGGGVTATSGAIAPATTATLEVDVREGDYALHTSDDGIAPASVKVGAARESAQGALLQP